MSTNINNTNLSQEGLNTDIVNKEDLLSNLEISTLIAKTAVPYSHRRIASKYNILKNICSFQIVQPRITMVEKDLLTKYSFNTLENTTITRLNNELLLLKEWAIATDDNLRDDATHLLEVRVKELKFILSNNYNSEANELLNGYKALDTYLVGISKYYK